MKSGNSIDSEWPVSILHFRPFRETDAHTALSWKYPAPFDFYDPPESGATARVADFMRPEFNYTAVESEPGGMIGFLCFGADARVPGGDYSQEALDIGGGLRPDHCGRGMGRHFLAAAMNHALNVFQPQHFRVTVANFNGRALSVWRGLGFWTERSFVRPADGRSFEILGKKAVTMKLAIPYRLEALGTRQGFMGS